MSPGSAIWASCHRLSSDGEIRAVVSTLRGTSGRSGHQDGKDAAQFYWPGGVAVDGDGNAIVADFGNHRIRAITPQVLVSTLAGTSEVGHRDGETTAAQFRFPRGVAVDRDTGVIVADFGNNCIRRISPQGVVSTLAGTGEWGHRDGAGTAAQFRNPSGVAVDWEGNVYVADSDNHRIRKISPQGLVSTLAGIGTAGHRDGAGTAAQFRNPSGVAVDWEGNVYVADFNNHRIRRISPQGLVSTLAGTGIPGYRDGKGNAAQFHRPWGVAVDGDDNVIVADMSNHRIRKISPQGVVSTLAGTGERGHRNGDDSAAQFNSPAGVAVDGEGNVIVADHGNHRIRVVASAEVTPLSRLPPVPSSTFTFDMQQQLDSAAFHDVCFVVEQQRVPAHRSVLSARSAYFKTMLSGGFLESDSPEIHIHGTSCAAFRALLKYLYTDCMEVEEEVLFDLAVLCDQYQVERLYTHCMRRLTKGVVSHQNAVIRLILQADAKHSVELLDREHHELFMQLMD
eukprot:1194495-Prorocentrum_minimum.AAC.4